MISVFGVSRWGYGSLYIEVETMGGSMIFVLRRRWWEFFLHGGRGRGSFLHRGRSS